MSTYKELCTLTISSASQVTTGTWIHRGECILLTVNLCYAQR